MDFAGSSCLIIGHQQHENIFIVVVFLEGQKQSRPRRSGHLMETSETEGCSVFHKEGGFESDLYIIAVILTSQSSYAG
jgi:hypothetical protein